MQMANRYMKTSSTSVIREIQIKSMMRYHLTLVRMATVGKSRGTGKCWQKYGEKVTLVYY